MRPLNQPDSRFWLFLKRLEFLRVITVEVKMMSSITLSLDKEKQAVSQFGTRRTLLNALQISLMAAGLVFVGGQLNAVSGSSNLMNSLRSAAPGFISRSEVASDVDTAIVSGTLTPRMKGALQNVAQRYHVSAGALVPVFEAIQVVAIERHLDPMLLVAVISIESRFNPFSESVVGAQGLMQIMPRYHQDKVPEGAGKLAFFDPVINVQAGAQILQESIRSQGGLVAGLQQYGGAISDEDRAYSAKVLAEKQRIEQATRRSA